MVSFNGGTPLRAIYVPWLREFAALVPTPRRLAPGSYPLTITSLSPSVPIVPTTVSMGIQPARDQGRRARAVRRRGDRRDQAVPRPAFAGGCGAWAGSRSGWAPWCSCGPGLAASAATDVVTNCNVSVSGSLPFEVANAGSGDTITFALSPACSTITLGATVDVAHSHHHGPRCGSLMVNGTGSTSVISVGLGHRHDLGPEHRERRQRRGAGGSTSSGKLTVADSTVSGNTASYVGGGIVNHGTLIVDDSTVSDNASYGGGGIDSEFATLTVTNSTLAGNTAAQDGGGIYIYDSYDPGNPSRPRSPTARCRATVPPSAARSPTIRARSPWEPPSWPTTRRAAMSSSSPP